MKVAFLLSILLFISCGKNDLSKEERKIVRSTFSTPIELTSSQLINSETQSEIIFENTNNFTKENFFSIGKISEADRGLLVHNESFLINVGIEKKTSHKIKARLVNSRFEPISDISEEVDGRFQFQVTDRAVIYDTLLLELVTFGDEEIKRSEIIKSSSCANGFYRLSNNDRSLKNICSGSSITYYPRLLKRREKIIDSTMYATVEFVETVSVKIPGGGRVSVKQPRSRDISLYFSQIITGEIEQIDSKDFENIQLSLNGENIELDFGIKSLNVNELSVLKVDNLLKKEQRFVGIFQVGDMAGDDLKTFFTDKKGVIKSAIMNDIRSYSSLGEIKDIKTQYYLELDVHIERK